MKHYLALVVLLMSAAIPVHPFSSGAPQAACTTLSPDATRHGASPQATDIPYVLNLSALYDPAIDQLVYTPNTVYDIVLEANTSAPTFRGFLIQPRLVADDSTVVGRFLEPPVGAKYRYGFCSYTEGSVTHNSNSEKSRITIPWTAPPNGTGSIQFGYVVVQTRQVYWANQRSATINERPCNLPFYLATQTNSCVQQCPIFTFGNHTTEQCQPFPAVLSQGLQADATAYYGSLQTDTPLGTEVFPFRIVIDRNRFTNNDISAIIVSLVRNNLVQSIFRFSDGSTDRQFLINLAGGIDAANASRLFPEIRLYDSRYILYEDSVIYQQAPPSTLELPTALDFELNILVVGVVTTDVSSLNPFAVGTVSLTEPPDPCDFNPCPDRRVCTVTGDETFTCSCHPAYSGDDCENLTDPCAFDRCQNGVNCTNINNSTDYFCDCGNEYTGQDCETTIDHCALLSPNCNNGSCVDGVGTFTCQCDPGFTGDFCDVDINECLTAGCQNGACEDLVNGFQCLCYSGWTGELCDINIDYCALDTSVFGPCDDTGANACMEHNSTYSCVCNRGYSGYNCSVDIDLCDPYPCLNGGTCTNFAPDRFECTCPSGYSGVTCEVDLTPCDPNPCGADVNCTDLGNGIHSCDRCPPPLYLDSETSTCVPQCPIFFFGNHTAGQCQPFPAVLDQGLHADATAYFGNVRSNTPLGTEVFPFRVVIDRTQFTNNDLQVIIVSLVRNNLVQNIFKFSDGTTDRWFMIDLAGGIDAVNASRVFPEIRLHDSRYVVYEDSVIYQQAPPSTLELPTILDFDLNILVAGVVTTDVASLTPFAVGTVSLTEPPDPCQFDPCPDRRVCTATGDETFICSCHPAYSGDDCENLIDPCAFDRCQNGVNCTNINNLTDYFCDCGDEFLGQDCETTIDHCALLSPNCNNGSCVDGVGTFTCQCDPGFTGEFCDVDIDECEMAGCQNGSCEDLVDTFRCLCYPGWTGELCDTDIDYCALDTSVFGPCDDTGANACMEHNSTYSCICNRGYSGYNCSVDIDLCDPYPCQNGGTCTNFAADRFECTCASGYSGATCGVDLTPCDPNPCGADGNCTDLGNGMYSCDQCPPPLYLHSRTSTCVRRLQCPIFFFANYTMEQCQPFPAVLDQGLQADATSYFGRIQTDVPIGTVVFSFRIVIDRNRFTNNDLSAIIVSLVRNNLVQNIFKFSDGTTDRQFLINLAGGIDAVNASRVFPEIRLYDSRYIVYEDSVIYQQAPPSTLELPTILDFDLNVLIVGALATDVVGVSPFAVGTVLFTPPPDPCFDDPCQNGSTCISNGETFTCNCAPGYTGSLCDVFQDPCTLEPCQNGGTCTRTSSMEYMCDCGNDFTGQDCETTIDHCALLSPNCNNGSCVDGVGTFTCQCDPGFTGDFCDVDINECLTAGCQNGQCEDLVNGFRCSCYPGWTGELCDTDIEYCALDTSDFGPCDDTGANACNDQNSTYTCTCVNGFTGYNCSEDIDECDPDPCQNGGNCTNLLFGVFECSCPNGFGGDTCEIAPNPCDQQPCVNGGTCSDLGSGLYLCMCAQGFTGQNCDLLECTPVNPCQNGGTCTEQDGPGFTCMCPPGFTDQTCGTVLVTCQSDSCFNGGTCIKQPGGDVSCNCTEGFDGERCQNDLPFCHLDSCLNGGTCVEGLGIATSCNCTQGFSSDRCEVDEPFCQSDSCLNGGTCVEGLGTATSCNCTQGFSGDRCEVAEPFCQLDSCLNGGTCIEDVGMNIMCNCTEGFGGDRCEIDLPFCTSDSCLNDGDCIEGIGTATSCDCGDGFDGDRCEIDLNFCQSDSCLNEGTCVEGYGTLISCNCTEGFDGDRCENDLPFCQTDSCLNGGTCVEGIGTSTTCNCTTNFTGGQCENVRDFCNGVTCMSGGSCVEVPGSFRCDCVFPYTGDLCEIEIMGCSQDICRNNGTCVEELAEAGTAIRCDCLDGFSGDICEEDDPTFIVCNPNLCQNGGTCTEDFGPLHKCLCPDGFAGMSCQVQIPSCSPNTPDPCQNGTCVRISSTEYTCNCSVDYTGENCDVPINDCDNVTCMQGGTCVDLIGGFHCQCPFPFTGELCDEEILTCSQNVCQNGGTCIEVSTMSNMTIGCDCISGFTGLTCELDDLSFFVCGPESCENKGTCVEEFGPAFSCSCGDGFGGTVCELDLDFCETIFCRNGGTCNEGVGTSTYCSCAPGFTGEDCTFKSELCVDGEFAFNGKCNQRCPEGFYGDGTTKDCKEIAEGYKLQLNATIYYASISSDAQIGSSVLDFTVYLNNSYYQTPSSVILQLEAGNQFTSYFSFRSGQRVDGLPFSTSNPAHRVDPLKVLSTIVYMSQAPPGRYQSTLTVTVRAREELGLSQLEDVQTSAILLTVTEDSYQPTDRLRLIYWVVAGVGTVVIVTVILCSVVSCWYCFMRKTKRKRYYFETAGAAMMIKNPNTGGLNLRSGTWTGSVRTKLQSRDSAPEMDAMETATTTFTNQLES